MDEIVVGVPAESSVDEVTGVPYRNGILYTLSYILIVFNLMIAGLVMIIIHYVFLTTSDNDVSITGSYFGTLPLQKTDTAYIPRVMFGSQYILNLAICTSLHFFHYFTSPRLNTLTLNFLCMGCIGYTILFPLIDGFLKNVSSEVDNPLIASLMISFFYVPVIILDRGERRVNLERLLVFVSLMYLSARTCHPDLIIETIHIGMKYIVSVIYCFPALSEAARYL